MSKSIVAPVRSEPPRLQGCGGDDDDATMDDGCSGAGRFGRMYSRRGGYRRASTGGGRGPFFCNNPLDD